jgi:hypothetical protein
MSCPYEITVRGHLGPALTADFQHLDVVVERRHSETVLLGRLDQSGLHGVLRGVEAFGLELIEVRRTEVPTVNGSPPASTTGPPASTSTTSSSSPPPA